jgi:hypothetical protein
VNQKSNEKTHKTAVVSLLIVVVQHEKISVLVLLSHINYYNHDEIQNCEQTIPSNNFAKTDREAKNVSVRYVIYSHQKYE